MSTPAEPPHAEPPHAVLNAMTSAEAHAALLRCCGAERWVLAMLERRPFASERELMYAADDVWARLGPDDYLAAFAHHPEIGANVESLRARFQTTAGWSSAEQAGVGAADEATLAALAAGNRAYKQRFGYIFIVCASGKSAREMLEALQARLGNTPDAELGIAAAEQSKITKLRLAKL
jgi:2-oxo-4-hydroxy-4-carboxy-5-ureidoimidazoline decarboxylase